MDIKISAVSYLNSKPLIEGLQNREILDHFQLTLDIPSVCAKKLIENEADIGLVPVAILPLLKEKHVISDYCIGAVGEVQSVLLVSKVPVDRIKRIMLDYQSRTSIQLTRVLANWHWKISPEWVDANEGYESKIDKETAAVIIGDRAFAARDQFPYVYDLSLEWYRFTGLPFVFACWVANKKLPDDFLRKFNRAIEHGLKNKDRVIAAWQEKYKNVDVKNYLDNCISYELDSKKLEGMNRFFTYLEELDKLETLPKRAAI
jgi:chorismate dehydratase